MIYVSVLHAPEDMALAERVVSALARRGCEAFPVSGAALEGDLADNDAPALVIWTPKSVRAPEIVRHARAALARDALIPVRVAGAAPVADFAALAPADLTGWMGDDNDPRWRFVMEEIALIAARGRLSDGDVWADRQAAHPEADDPGARCDPMPVEAAGQGPDDSARPDAGRDAGQDSGPASEPEAPSGFDFTPPLSAPAPHGRSRLSVRHAVFIVAGVLVAATGLAAFTAPMIFTAQETPQRSAAAPETPPSPASLAALTVDIPEPDAARPAAAQTDNLPSDETGALAPEPELKSPPPLRDVQPMTVARGQSSVAEADPAADATEESAGRDLVVAYPPRLKPAGEQDGQSVPEAETGSIEGAAALTGEAADDLIGDYMRDCVDCPDMAVIPAGRFLMGSPSTEQARHEAEGPVALIDISRGFAMAAREITMAQWDACVAGGGCSGYTPPAHDWGRGEQPVVSVSFDDARDYADWLSRETGRSYRLPSEAEWEYAARAGASAPFSFGFRLTPDDANYNAAYTYGGPVGTAAGRAVKTASFAPNAFGLYDMHGNVWEWTADCWSDSHQDADVNGASRTGANGGDCTRRVLKGGAWNTGGWRLRSAHRIGKPSGVREYDNGFRVVRALD